MNELILIRHGKSEYNARMTTSLDSALATEGIEQINRTGAGLAFLPHIDRFVGHVSPYLRTLQTAAIIKKHTGVNFKVTLGPREIMTFYEHCKIGDHLEHFTDFDWTEMPDIKDGIDVYNEDKETYLDRMERYVREEATDDQLIVVSHGIPVVTMMEMSMGIRRSPSNYFYVSNGSITHVSDSRLVRYNYVQGS